MRRVLGALTKIRGLRKNNWNFGHLRDIGKYVPIICRRTHGERRHCRIRIIRDLRAVMRRQTDAGTIEGVEGREVAVDPS